ncbi:MAG: ABC transporter substrate-binding protein [Parasporobacterium sp.]|nr:ABC transporter substrate-binding protein [Parasporobacterium sp.]
MKKVLAILLACMLVIPAFALTASAEDAAPKGSVYWLNFKPESDEALQAIAAKYTEETGVPVKVVTAASGTYSQTLTAEMDKSSAPTLFVVGNQAGVETWGDYCYDLTGTPVAEELNTDAYNLYDADGKLCSIGYSVEAFGIIANKELLEKAGHSLDEITNFETLKAVADDIHARAEELGFDAFTSSGMDDSSSWRFSGHLANLDLFYESRDAGGWTETPAEITGAYLENFKNLWDLYTTDTATDKSALATGGFDARDEFGTGKAAFYQNGSWEYAALTGSGENEYGMDPANLAMIPFYGGVEGEEEAGLNCGTENCWAVNAKASEDDIQATLDFMYWLVTDGSEDAVATFGLMPYTNAVAPDNTFLAQADQYTVDGKYVMTWAFNFTPNVDDWRAGVVSAMNQYDAGGDWAMVEAAFVQGWAQQYSAINE